MPKLKTNRSAKKRIRITKSGKAKYFKAGRGHLLTGKSSKRKRTMGNDGYIESGELKSIHKMLPYGA
jgi:large subunit ribosomal protein L35